MRLYLTLPILIILLCSGFLGCSKSRDLADFTSSKLEYHPPKVSTRKLDNGLRIVYLQDLEVPLTRGTLYFPGGSRFEPRELAGLAGATGAQMREGGTVNYTPAELDLKLDSLGAGIESSFGDEYGTVSFSCLTEDIDEVTTLFSEVITAPRFDKKRFEGWKLRRLSSISRRADSPDVIASLTFSHALFGSDSEYVRTPDSESTKAIGSGDLKRFFNRFVVPDNAILGVVSDLPEDEFFSRISKKLGGWSKSSLVMPPQTKPKQRSKGTVYVVKKDLDQATIVMGHFGPPRQPKDFHSITVFNRIFGLGGFDSRLFEEVRTKAGLAYSVYGGLFPGSENGTFEVRLGTRKQAAPEAISIILDVINGSLKDSADDPTLKKAKQAVERSFVFKFDSSRELVSRRVLLQLLDYPNNFDDVYLDKIEGVSRDDLLASARKWIDPKDLVIVIVGDVELEQLRKKLPDYFTIKTAEFDEVPKF